MAATLKFTNFASTTIATASVGTGDLSLAVTAGTGALFPTLSGAQYFYATIVDSLTAPTKKEIVKVTARSTDTFTITRAQDNTTAQTWVTGNYIALRHVAAVMTDTNWLNVLGTANQITVANSGTDITLSTPQSIHSAATPTFAGMTISGLTQSNVVYAGASGILTGNSKLQFINSDAVDTQNLKLNGGLSAATLAQYAGVGPFRLAVGSTYNSGAGVYDLSIIETDFWNERTDNSGLIESGVSNDGTGGARWNVFTSNAAGDLSYTVRRFGVQTYQWGMDTSDGNAFVFGLSTSLGTNNVYRISTTGDWTWIAGSAKQTHATAGLGYGTGAGGTVTQLSTKATTVILNKSCGQITMNSATLNAATIVSFTLTNSAIGLGDVLILNHVATGTFGAYSLNGRCAAGSAIIDVRNNTAGNLGEAIVINFVVIKAVTA